MESLQEKGKYATNHDEQASVTNGSGVCKHQSATQKNETTYTTHTTDGIARTRTDGGDYWDPFGYPIADDTQFCTINEIQKKNKL